MNHEPASVISRWARWGIQGAVRDLLRELDKRGMNHVIVDFDSAEDVVLIVARRERASEYRAFAEAVAARNGERTT